MGVMAQKMDEQIEGSLYHQAADFPEFKTQIEIVRQSMQRYAQEFLMNDDPPFTADEALAIINRMYQTEYFIEINDIFEQL